MIDQKKKEKKKGFKVVKISMKYVKFISMYSMVLIVANNMILSRFFPHLRPDFLQAELSIYLTFFAF